MGIPNTIQQSGAGLRFVVVGPEPESFLGWLVVATQDPSLVHPENVPPRFHAELANCHLSTRLGACLSSSSLPQIRSVSRDCQAPSESFGGRITDLCLII